MLSKLSSKTSSRSARYELTSSSSRSKTETPSVAGAASSPNHVVVAIVEGRGGAKGEIGLASMDIRRPQLNLAQFSDTASYTKLRIRLQVLNPVEIIVPDSAIESGGNMSILVETIKVDLTQTKVTPIPRRHFNETKAMESIKTLKTPDCSTIEKDIAEKYYCLSCAGALLNYIEHIQNILFAPSSVKVVYRGVEKTCMLDLSTVKNLELIVSLKNGTDTTNSLFGVLNRTFTSSGQRMLRACILQPSADLNVIEQRLDAIEELLNNEEAFTSLRTWISRVLDVDHLVALCSHVSKSDEAIKTCEYKIAQVIHLKHTLELIEPLRNALASLKSTLFVGYYQSLLDDRFESILNSIREVLNEDVRVEKGSLNTKMQKCFAVKSNINGLLDISRRTYTELLGDTSELCADVVNETHLPFKVSYANGRGFYLSLRINEVCFPKKPPEILINVTRRNNLIQCSTEKMVQLNDRINEIVGEVLFLSNVIVTDVLSNLRNSITCLYNLTEVISCVDFITSLAQVCTISTANMVRPRFMDSLALKQAFHPILEKISPSEVTLNDVFIGPDCNFVIVTGPNMVIIENVFTSFLVRTFLF